MKTVPMMNCKIKPQRIKWLGASAVTDEISQHCWGRIARPELDNQSPDEGTAIKSMDKDYFHTT